MKKPEAPLPSHAHYILALDLGTSGLKLALFSDRGHFVAYEHEPLCVRLLPDGGAEQDVEQWWDAIKRSVHRLLARGLVPIDTIRAISCTGQWSGTVAVDQSGKALMSPIIWMDSRGAPYLDKLTKGLIPIAGYGTTKLLQWLWLTGGAPGKGGKDSLAHILYIKHKHPDVLRNTYKFLEPKDYINLRLTGQFAASYDSVTLYWLTKTRNIHRIDYSDRLMKAAGIRREMLPDLRRAVDILGPILPKVANELGLSNNVQVVCGSPDTFSGAIGAGAVEDYRLHLCLGTSSWLTCHVPTRILDPLHNMASLPSAIPDRYMLMNEQDSAGICLAFLKDKILFPDDALGVHEPPDVMDRILQVAQQAPAGSNRVIFTPWLNGERTPVENHLIRGSFVNLSLQSTRADMIRAVLEGVAFNSRWLLQGIERLLRRESGVIHAIGGGSRSDLWCQIHADILGRPIAQMEDPIMANVRGAALIASVAMGVLRFTDIPARVNIQKVYEPDPSNTRLYNALFREFVEIYKCTKNICARLNAPQPS